MKRVLNVFLTLALVLSMVIMGNTAVFAAEGDFTYTIVANSTATITGYTGTGGDVAIPSTLGGVPVTSIGDSAFIRCTSLTSISIPQGVTSIGSMAFMYCSGLRSISIPEGVTSIGGYAFVQCTRLTSIIIPQSVTSIGTLAFSDCSGLTSISIPQGVTSIGSYAFDGTPWINNYIGDLVIVGNNILISCKRSAISVTIPNSVTSIAGNAFTYCTSLTSISIPEGVTSIGNSAFSNCSGLTSISLPQTLTSIGTYAFQYCSGLTSISLPETLTTISEGAFDYCSGLTSISLPQTLTKIGAKAFEHCSRLTSISLPQTLTTISDYAFSYSGLTSISLPGTTSIGSRAFEGCSDLTTINILQGATFIANYAFSGCTGLTSISFPQSVTSIGFSAFADCTGLTSISIPRPVRMINQGAFAGCTNLTSIRLNSSTTGISDTADTIPVQAKIIGYVPSFAKDYATKYDRAFEVLTEDYLYTIADSTATITEYTGAGGAVTIPYTLDGVIVTSISDSAFSYCTALTSVSIPEGVTSIGDQAFFGCTRLTSIRLNSSTTAIFDSADTIPVQAKITGYVPSTAKDYAAKYSRTFEALTRTVTFIADGATIATKTVVYGATLIDIPEVPVKAGYTGVWETTDYTNITANKTVTAVYTEDYTYTIADSTATITGYIGAGGAVTIPDKLGGATVTSIGYAAFAACTGLTSVSIPRTVTSIGDNAFQDCTGLTSISLPLTLTSIGFEAFYNCTGLTSISLPQSVTSISGFAFESCTGLTSISIPQSVTSIGDGAFYGCIDLTSITVDADNSNYKSIDGVLFNKEVTALITCPGGLTSISIPQSVTSISDFAFESCIGLTSISIPQFVTSIGFGGISDCTSLTSISIPQSVTSIGDYAFYGCTGLTSITFNSATTTISDSADTIPDTTKIIGYELSTAKDYASNYNREFGILVIHTVAADADLDTAKATEGLLTATDYVDYSAVTAALALPEVTNANVIAKTTAINTAITNLVFAGKAALDTAKATEAALTPADYVDYSAVTAAKELPETTNAEVVAKTTAINTAIANLVFAGQAALDTAKAAEAALTPADYADYSAVTTAKGLPETTNAEVVAKTTAINTAIANLVFAGKAALDTAKAAEALLISADYVSYAAVTTAKALPETTNAEVVSKTTAINSAITNLVFAGKAALDTAKATEALLTAADYVDYSTVTAAIALPEVTNANVIAKTTALNTAITNLVFAGKAALDTAKVAEALLVPADYVSYAAVITVKALPETTNAEVVSKTTAINSAITNLVFAGQAALDTAKAAEVALTPADYADYSAVVAAKGLPETTNAEVVAKTTAINTAIANLVFAGQAALDTAKAAEGLLTATDYVDYSAVTAALALPEVTNAEVVAKTTALNNAMAALVKTVAADTDLDTAKIAEGLLTATDYVDYSAVTAAKGLPETTNGEVLAKTTALNNAMAALVTVAADADLDTAKTAEGLLTATDYVDYSAVSAALALPEVTNANVVAKITAIYDAIADLVTVRHSSRGGGSTTQVTQPGVDIIVNGDVVNAGIAVDTTEEGKTVTTITVDEAKLEQKLSSEGNAVTVTIPINSDSDKLIGQLNGQMVKDMEDKHATIAVQTGSATYTLPASEINIGAVSAQLGTDVSLTDITVQIAIATPSDQTVTVVKRAAEDGGFLLVVPAVDFTISCTYNGKTVDVSNFNSYVERTMAIPDGVDPAKITTGVVVNPDGTVRHVPTRVTIINGKYYAVIKSLTNSTYTVIWNPIEFSDVTTSWAKDSINDMGSRMVVTGVGDNNYAPDRDITRAEFAAIVVRALGLKPGTGNNPFADVKSSDWYCDYVKTAYEYKLISGYSADTFGPADKITREEAMTMVARAMSITGLKAELKADEAEKLIESFNDSVNTADYAIANIAACIKTGIVSGRENNLIAPKDNITRAEVAAIVQRLLQKSNLI